MFIEDIRNDFYNVLLGNRVLLLVHYDVDAICACKILQDLFKCDNISYTLVPVGGITELKSAYDENNEEVKYVVLVNCGGTVDLVDALQPEEHVVFFVLDSHKPTDICNVYSDGQVRLVHKDEEENIPNFDDIFRDDEDDEEEEQEESGARPGIEEVVERRRARKAWEERRHTLMFNYTQFSYRGTPSACVALELAVRASRCTVPALWSAAVACASHEALHCRSPARCLLDAEPLHRYVAAAQRKTTDDDIHQAARVVVEKDVWLPLYRWWSVEGALSHSPSLAPKLRLHARSGAARLRQLLADMGFPLQQARQAYRSMDVELRRSLLSALEAAAPKHKLPVPTRATFLLQRPHAPPLAALDAVYAVMGLIENETVSRAEGFQHALAALTVGGENESLKRGVAAARRCLEAVARAAHSTLSARGLMLAGPFNYFIVQEVCTAQYCETVSRAEGFQHALAALTVGGENESLKRGVAAARRCLEAVARAAHSTLSARGLMLAGPFNYFIVQEVCTAQYCETVSRAEGFQHALAALTVGGENESLKRGVAAARRCLEAVARAAHSTLSARGLMLAGPFNYFIVQEVCTAQYCETVSRAEGFQHALAALTVGGENESLKRGVAAARRCLEAVARAAHSTLSARGLMLAGPFNYFIVQEVCTAQYCETVSRAEGFQHALAALTVGGENESLKRGVAAARRCLEAVARAAHSTLSARGLMLAGPFNYFIVQEVCTAQYCETVSRAEGFQHALAALTVGGENESLKRGVAAARRCLEAVARAAHSTLSARGLMLAGPFNYFIVQEVCTAQYCETVSRAEGFQHALAALTVGGENESLKRGVAAARRCLEAVARAAHSTLSARGLMLAGPFNYFIVQEVCTAQYCETVSRAEGFQHALAALTVGGENESLKRGVAAARRCLEAVARAAHSTLSARGLMLAGPFNYFIVQEVCTAQYCETVSRAEGFQHALAALTVGGENESLKRGVAAARRCLEAVARAAHSTLSARGLMLAGPFNYFIVQEVCTAQYCETVSRAEGFQHALAALTVGGENESLKRGVAAARRCLEAVARAAHSTLSARGLMLAGPFNYFIVQEVCTAQYCETVSRAEGFQHALAALTVGGENESLKRGVAAARRCLEAVARAAHSTLSARGLMLAGPFNYFIVQEVCTAQYCETVSRAEGFQHALAALTVGGENESLKRGVAAARRCLEAVARAAHSTLSARGLMLAGPFNYFIVQEVCTAQYCETVSRAEGFQHALAALTVGGENESLKRGVAAARRCLEAVARAAHSTLSARGLMLAGPFNYFIVQEVCTAQYCETVSRAEGFQHALAALTVGGENESLKRGVAAARRCLEAVARAAHSTLSARGLMLAGPFNYFIVQEVCTAQYCETVSRAEGFQHALAALTVGGENESLKRGVAAARRCLEAVARAAHSTLSARGLMLAGPFNYFIVQEVCTAQYCETVSRAEGFQHALAALTVGGENESLKRGVAAARRCLEAVARAAHSTLSARGLMLAGPFNYFIVQEVCTAQYCETVSRAEGFQHALAALTVGGENESLKRGVAAARRCLEAVARAAHSTLSARGLMLAGPFNYFIVQEVCTAQYCETVSRAEGFQHALAALTVGGENESLKRGVAAARRCLEAVARAAHSTLSARGLMLAGPFNYFIVQEVCTAQYCETVSRAEGFQHALAALTVGGENESLKRGVAAARRCLEAVARAAHSTLSARGLMLAGPFNYFIVQEVCTAQYCETVSRAEGFQHALAALTVGGENESLKRGVAAARRCLEAVARAAHSTLSARGLMLAGPFNYFIVQEGTPEAAALRGPLWLSEAARWVAGAHAHAPRPLLASAPTAHGDCLLLGLPPRFDQEPRNLFGAAFEQAAAKSGASVSLEFVDSSIIRLPISQRAQFLDALTALLA